MRMLMIASMPIEKGNAVMKDGSFGKIMHSILEEQKPESVYFSTRDGQRTAYLVMNINDASEIPKIAEPWFLAFNASIDIQPVMVPQDLAKATPAIEEAVKKYA